eukprot:1744911-Pyramimonas_sp.AAC.1
MLACSNASIALARPPPASAPSLAPPMLPTMLYSFAAAQSPERAIMGKEPAGCSPLSSAFFFSSATKSATVDAGGPPAPQTENMRT